jgi:hypothetical protein
MPNEIQEFKPPSGAQRFPDDAQWKNKFGVRSESSGKVYVVSQNKQTGKWGCSCPGYLIHRKCKHLVDGCGLSLLQIHGYAQLAEKKRDRMG